MKRLEMTLDKMKKLTTGVGLVFALLLGSGILTQTTAQASVRTSAVYDRRDDQQKGYSDGLDRGKEDAHDHKSFNPNNSDHYRDGNRWYKEGFRRGYAEGYGRRRHRR
jgi:hypothetical protein